MNQKVYTEVIKEKSTGEAVTYVICNPSQETTTTEPLAEGGLRTDRTLGDL